VALQHCGIVALLTWIYINFLFLLVHFLISSAFFLAKKNNLERHFYRVGNIFVVLRTEYSLPEFGEKNVVLV